MKFFPTLVPAVLMAALIGAVATPATAQVGAPNISVPAPVPYHSRYEFHNYLNNNPKVAGELEKNPRLATDPRYLKDHPDLRNIINRDPGLQRQLREDPKRVMERYQYQQRYRQKQSTGPSGSGTMGQMGSGSMGPGMGSGATGPAGDMGSGMGAGGMGSGMSR